MDDDGHAKRLVAEPARRSQSHIKQIDHWPDMGALGETDTNGFAGAFEAGKRGVDVQGQVISGVPRHNRAHAVMDVRAVIDDLHQAVEVLQRGIAVVAVCCIEDLNSRPPGADMHPAAANHEPAIFVISGQGNLFGRAFD